MSGDAKYFTTTRKGEIHELRQELNSMDKKVVLAAVKKVIAFMTVGKDVSSLFPHVVKNMQSENLELKKLVYLYLMNYARSNPDLAILSVNTFVNDATTHPNPLVRALAIRTMGCIRDPTMSQQLSEPLSKALKDTDPYVRKTAAICVAKLYDINPEECREGGFLERLQDLLGDANHMVVANAVAALSEIASSAGPDIFPVDKKVINKLLAALSECTEWGQVFILDALARYEPRDGREAESICDRITPRLAHSNSSVVLNAVKVLLKLFSLCSIEFQRTLTKKMAPPLVTLLSAEPEIQYVALRNIELIIQKKSSILAHEIRVFYCKYNDPVYVKLEKLEIMVRLATERNIDKLLNEFKEYAQEVDVEFVRRSVRAIGRCAIKLEDAANRCVEVLLELIGTKVNYVVQEAIVVIKDIFRRYPNKYEKAIAPLCENLDSLDEPEAKASMIWIIGEYAERIDQAHELLESFLDSFTDEPPSVQLQLLTATVKLFLKKSDSTQEMVQRVLKSGTEDSDNPDLRDRAYVYWRLLSTDPEAAKSVVLSEKPLISDDTNNLDPSLLSTLLTNISSLSSVFHKPPEAFVARLKSGVPGAKADSSKASSSQPSSLVPEVDEEAKQAAAAEVAAAKASIVEVAGSGKEGAAIANLLDLDLDLGPTPAPAGAGLAGLSNLDGLSGFAPNPGSNTAAPASLPVRKAPLLSGEKGFAVSGAFVNRSGVISLETTIENRSPGPASGFAFQFNKNSYGLSVGGAPTTDTPNLGPNSSGNWSQPCTINPSAAAPGPVNPVVQVAIKLPNDVDYFTVEAPLHICFTGDGKMEKGSFLDAWKAIPDSQEHTHTINDIPREDAEAVSNSLSASNLFFVALRKVDGSDIAYLSCKVMGTPILLELTFTPGTYSVKCCARTSNAEIIPHLWKSIEILLRST